MLELSKEPIKNAHMLFFSFSKRTICTEICRKEHRLQSPPASSCSVHWCPTRNRMLSSPGFELDSLNMRLLLRKTLAAFVYRPGDQPHACL